MMLDWIPFARCVQTTHCDERPTQTAIELVVIHNISLPPDCFSGTAVELFFQGKLDPQAHPYFQSIEKLRVSAHFFIRRNGELLQFVPLSKRAWHAGISQWQGRTHCNDFSIGIELEGADQTPYTQKQYQKLRRLLNVLKKNLPIHSVLGHCDIAPTRKTDPGPAFNWKELYKVGLSSKVT